MVLWAFRSVCLCGHLRFSLSLPCLDSLVLFVYRSSLILYWSENHFPSRHVEFCCLCLSSFSPFQSSVQLILDEGLIIVHHIFTCSYHISLLLVLLARIHHIINRRMDRGWIDMSSLFLIQSQLVRI